MRRGAVIIIVIIILVALVGVGLLFALLGGAQIAQDGPSSAGQAPSPTPEPVPVVVSPVDIPVGTVISDTASFDISVELLPETRVPPDAITNLSDVNNKLVVAPIRGGEPIVESDLDEPGLSQQIPPADGPNEPRPKAYPFEVDNLTGVADQIQINDFVDVVATFAFQRRIAVPTEFQTNLEFEEFFSTKTIVQRAQVLRILRPRRQPAAEGEEGAPAAGGDVAPAGEPVIDEATGQPIRQDGSAQQNNTIRAGTWTIVLAVSDQEAELIEFAQVTGVQVSLVLRGAGDDVDEDTVGTTLNLLVSQFGLPLPEPLTPALIIPPNQ